jgi:hypothetical protein
MLSGFICYGLLYRTNLVLIRLQFSGLIHVPEAREMRLMWGILTMFMSKKLILRNPKQL